MNEYLALFLPLYFPIVLGLLVRVSGYFSQDFANAIVQFCLKISIPLFIFMSTAAMDADALSQVLSMTLALPIYMSILWLAALAVTLIPLFRRHRTEGVLIILLGNIGYFGWAVTNIGMGSAALVRNLMFTALFWPLTIVFSILTKLVLDRSAEGIRSVLALLRVAVPILAAFFLGLAFALLGWSVPEILGQSLNTFGGMTVPLILFGVGLSLTFKIHWGTLALLLPLRLLLALGAGWLTSRMLGSLDETSRAVILIVSQMPVAASTLIMGNVMRLDSRFISGAVALSALMALATIPLTLFLFA